MTPMLCAVEVKNDMTPRETLAVAVREAIPDDKVRGNQADGHG